MFITKLKDWLYNNIIILRNILAYFLFANEITRWRQIVYLGLLIYWIFYSRYAFISYIFIDEGNATAIVVFLVKWDWLKTGSPFYEYLDLFYKVLQGKNLFDEIENNKNQALLQQAYEKKVAQERLDAEIKEYELEKFRASMTEEEYNNYIDKKEKDEKQRRRNELRQKAEQYNKDSGDDITPENNKKNP